MQLNPREAFTIVRQIEDHTDSNTYYVRAVVRNARTDALLATVDLTDRGSQRFSEDYQVPADASGQGFYISVMTSVYTDSGYTTKSENYGDKMETYLVQERYVFNPNYPLPTGQDIDYKKIKKIVKEVVEEELNQFEVPTPETKVVTVTKEVIKEIKVPEVKIVETQKAIDLKPILEAIKGIGQKVDNKAVTEIPDLDIKPILKQSSAMADHLEKIDKKLDSLKVEVKMSYPVVEAEARPTVPDYRISRLMKTQ